MYDKEQNQLRLQYIAKKIKENREKRNMTQAQLAEMANMGRTTVGLYEQMKVSSATLINLYAIADALEIPLAKLLIPETAKEEKEPKSIGALFAMEGAELKTSCATESNSQGIANKFEK